jgi:hypothetical protein
VDQSDGAPQGDMPQVYGAHAEQSPFSDDAEGRPSRSENGNRSALVSTANAAQQPGTLIYLGDGTNYAVTNYWLAGGDLHHVTNYGAENSVPIGQIDLQRTVDANAAQAIQFTLRPAPSASDSGVER